MSRVGLSCIIATVIAGAACSNTERTKAPSSGERPTAVGSGGAGATLGSDDEFVHDVAVKNSAAMELSRLAAARATRPDVKAFAEGVLNAAGAAGAALKNAGGAAAGASALADDDREETIDDLAGREGADFDRAYLKAMVEDYQDLTATLESRLDVQSLADWKTAVAGRAQGKALPDPNTALPDVRIRPGRATNDSGAKVNQWAADTYPMAQKQLDTARTLRTAIEDR